MKDTETKAKYIELRAQGKSYSAIAEELSISKSTCSSWEQELSAQIQERKGERLEELYLLYDMSKEDRIKRLGETLQSIDKALGEKDLSELPADVLLKLKLRYEQELKAEYIDTATQPFTECSGKEFVDALTALYEKQDKGELRPAQVKAQLSTLNLLMVADSRKRNEERYGR